ncbi:MAG: 50S ribosomal protein L15 [Rickettsiales bacterium]|jgi:large subunit ribosomal protein L15|nr:50S ribosomal protein L15 [Rickettsiales bacterium]
MKLNELKSNAGATHYKKRVGRGMSSGTGKTAGRGTKGAGARAGARKLATFQGGQLNILRRFPKFGFVNIFAKKYAELNLADIEKFIASGKIDSAKEINIDSLIAGGVLNRKKDGLKILGRGELKSKANIVAAKWSKSAEAAITKAGGTIAAAAEPKKWTKAK